MKLENVINSLVYLSTATDENANLDEWKANQNVSLPLAFAIKYEFAKPTEKGKAILKETYDYLVEIAKARGVSVLDLADTDTPIPTQTITVRL